MVEVKEWFRRRGFSIGALHILLARRIERDVIHLSETEAVSNVSGTVPELAKSAENCVVGLRDIFGGGEGGLKS